MKDKITGWDSFWFDSLVLTGWNILALPPVSDNIDGFTKLTDDNDLLQELVPYFQAHDIGGERDQEQNITHWP